MFGRRLLLRSIYYREYIMRILAIVIYCFVVGGLVGIALISALRLFGVEL